MKTSHLFSFESSLCFDNKTGDAPTQFILLFALLLWPGSAFAQGGNPLLLTTITNPTPANSDSFGGSVAAMGSDRVLIEGRTKIYLFSLNGTLQATFTDPAHMYETGFGTSMAAVGSDRVLVGSYDYWDGGWNLGRAYLFDTNGALVTTFTNPAPATIAGLGWSVAAAGSDRVLISGLGGVCLFRTDGTLLTILTNPIPAYAAAAFGKSVAAVGSDLVLVGAPDANTGATNAGSAYLFSTNGTLLTTFTNPAPKYDDHFGTTVVAVGDDHVLITALDSGGLNLTFGEAYLFSINGALISTFTNPTVVAIDNFGWSAVAVGSNRVLIGEHPEGNAGDYSWYGAAYLFSTNGALLNTITNPTPVDGEGFGWSVAAVGTDRVIICGVNSSIYTGEFPDREAYLLALPYPPLKIMWNAGAVSVSWVTPETGLILQQADLLGTPTMWSDTTNLISISGLTNVVQQAIGSANTSRYYRLRRP